MFLKKKKEILVRDRKATQVDEKLEDNASEKQQDTAAKQLSNALSNYEKIILEAEKPEINPELTSAREKLNLAMQVINGGRINYALCKCLISHTKHWHAWSLREDFRKWIHFDATEISATKISNMYDTSFDFEDNHYRYTLLDHSTFGEVDFFVNNEAVLSMELNREEKYEIDWWWGTKVKLLKPGQWMKDLLKISAQIEVRQRVSWQADNNEKTLKYAQAIDLSNIDNFKDD